MVQELRYARSEASSSGVAARREAGPGGLAVSRETDLPADRQPGRRRVLVVEDEHELATLLRLWLERHGWEAGTSGDHADALAILEPRRRGILLLDIGSPGLDGWHALETIRATRDLPVLLVTALGSETGRAHDPSLEADEDAADPLGLPDLMARIEAALSETHPVDDPDGTAIRCGRLVVDTVRHRVEALGTEIHLTPTQFRLLQYLIEHSDRVVRHRELLGAVWGSGYQDEIHLLQATVQTLRAKLAAVIGDSAIETVYGTGYRFVES